MSTRIDDRKPLRHRGDALKWLAHQAAREPQFDIAQRHHAAASSEDGPDAALAAAIVHRAMVRWLTMRTVIESGSSRPWNTLSPEVRGALIGGAVQLLLLDRVPDHAAIDTTVEWVKNTSQRKAAGFVNAILRRIGRLRGERLDHIDLNRRDCIPLPDGTSIFMTDNIFPKKEVNRLAKLTSVAPQLVERWIAVYGTADASALCLHSLTTAPIVMRNTPDGIEDLSPHDEAGFSVFGGRAAQLRSLLESHPDCLVQDAGTAAAMSLLDNVQPTSVLDYCAGVGTKTRDLLNRFPEATVYACEVDRGRRRRLEDMIETHDRAELLDVRDIRDGQVTAAIDLLVLDVPCSNTAVLPRRPEARYRHDQDALSSLVDLQRQIVADALATLKPGGHLLYITCSIDEAENEEQVKWMEQWHPLKPVARHFRLPTGVPGDGPARYSDGGFATLLQYLPDGAIG